MLLCSKSREVTVPHFLLMCYVLYGYHCFVRRKVYDGAFWPASAVRCGNGKRFMWTQTQKAEALRQLVPVAETV